MATTKELESQGYYVASIDAKNSPTLDSFLCEIAKAFQFPDYYSGNMNSFLECINDLDWLDSKNFALVITNSDTLLSDDLGNRSYALEKLEAVRKEWNSVPNYAGEEEFRTKADFQILLL